MSEPTIRTTGGLIRGAKLNDVYVFKGIHYGASTDGRNRFLPPQPVKPWTGVREATAFRPICPQVVQNTGREADLNALCFDDLDKLPQSEDCLSLNIWTSGTGDGVRRPVMVWLHRGGFIYGSPVGRMFDGAALARRGVVLVSVTHRINVFGFLYLADIFGKEFAASGTVGMLDLVLALKWIRDNIESFGGNPHNVTIFGESGGSRKVCILMAMPSAKGLFQRAIIESSPGLRGQETTQATDYAERLLAKLDIKPGQIDKLRGLPPGQLLNAANLPPPPAGVIGAGKSMPLNPVVDGAYLPVHPFDPVAAPTASEIPIIIGTNRDEAALFLANDPQRSGFTESELRRRLAPGLGERLEHIIGVYRKNRPAAKPWDIYIAIMSEDRRLGCIQLAERKTAGGKAPVFMYLFTWQTNYQDYIYKSCHTLEIPFAFGNVRDVPFTGSRSDKYELAEAVTRAWCSFAQNGDPTHSGIPRWEPWKPERRSTMIFDVPPRLEIDPFREELDAWKGLEIVP